MYIGFHIFSERNNTATVLESAQRFAQHATGMTQMWRVQPQDGAQSQQEMCTSANST